MEEIKVDRTSNALKSTLSRRAAIIGALTTVSAAAIPEIAQAAQTTSKEEGGESPADGATPAAEQLVDYPDTLVGRNLKSWVAAINSGDPDVWLAHYEAFPSPGPAENSAAVDLLNARLWGQLIVHRIESSSETKLSLYAESTRIEEWMMIKLEIDGERMAFGIEGAKPPEDLLPTKRLSDEELNAEMTRYMEKLSDADVFSGAVLIARKGEIVFAGAYGKANVALDEANALGTRFNLGSMNKMMTSVGIAQLVEAGKLAFTDTVATHLSNYPAEVAERITIEQLLTHTLGSATFSVPSTPRKGRRSSP